MACQVRCPRIVGHRGARGARPENTLAAVDYALGLGLDLIEVDVQLSAEGVPMVTHDPRLNADLVRDAGGAWVPSPGPAVGRLTVAQLNAYDVGAVRPRSPTAAAFPAQTAEARARIPTLAAVLDRVRPEGAEVLVEIKSDPDYPGLYAAPGHLARTVADDVARAGMAARVIYQSFDWRVLDALRLLNGGTRLSFLTSVAAAGAPRNLYPGSPWLGEAAWHASKLPPPMAVAGLGGQVWAPAESDLTPDLVETAHRAGLQVFAWTVNRAETALKLGNWGVDALITDYPEEIARVFSQAGAAEE